MTRQSSMRRNTSLKNKRAGMDLKKHYDEPSSRMSLLEEIYKEEDKKGKEKIKTDKENR